MRLANQSTDQEGRFFVCFMSACLADMPGKGGLQQEHNDKFLAIKWFQYVPNYHLTTMRRLLACESGQPDGLLPLTRSSFRLTPVNNFSEVSRCIPVATGYLALRHSLYTFQTNRWWLRSDTLQLCGLLMKGPWWHAQTCGQASPQESTHPA